MTKAKKNQTTPNGAVEINEETLDQAAGGFSWGATNTGTFKAKTSTVDSLSLTYSKIEV